MKKQALRIVALLLTVALLLGGCSGSGAEDWLDRILTLVQLGMVTTFEEMEYARPDVTAFQELLDETMAQIPECNNVNRLMQNVYALYEYYYDYSTNYNLANIRYCQNMKDTYWQQEYSWCMENSTRINAGMDQLLYALADSPVRAELEEDAFFGPGFFDAYEGQSLWDDTFIALMERESQLLEQYYLLNAQALEVEYYSEAYFEGIGAQIEEVFAQLILARRDISDYAGYESYPEFAYDFYHYRDYTPAQANVLLQDIRTELTQLYDALDADVWQPAYDACSEAETLDYVRRCAESMGGVAADAFAMMERGNLYDITYSENKYNASFEVYLINYYQPFVFMCPSGGGRDLLTFTHEFGHFCNDYAGGGMTVGVDVAEIFSQSLEYLSLCYVDGPDGLAEMKMADSLCVFVEQAAYADFEQQVYTLERENVTVETIRRIYAQVCDDYALASQGRDSREYTLIPHIFISPMYLISYVVSNNAAMQIYQMELQEQGAGLALWEDSLFTVQVGYLAFLEEAGLESPFTEGSMAGLRKLFEEKLA